MICLVLIDGIKFLDAGVTFIWYDDIKKKGEKVGDYNIENKIEATINNGP